MMPFIQEALGQAMLAAGGSLAVSIVTKGTFIMAIGLLGIRLARRAERRFAMRC
jgi:hypothetical protein